MKFNIWSGVIKISPAKHIVFFSLFSVVFAVFVNRLIDFDGIDFNGDSYVYFRMAQHFKQAISNAALPSHQHWPYGYPALLSITFFIGETFKAAQWINFIAGGGLIAAAGGMALFIARIKNLDQEKTILVVLGAMLLLFGRGIMLKYQLLIMSDMMGAFWAMLLILLIWKWKVSKSPFPLAFAGISIGLAVSTRYVDILMLVPLAIVLLSGFSLRKTFFYVFIFGFCFLIALLPEILIVHKGTAAGISYDLINDWSFKNLFTRSFESVDGHQTSQLPSILYYAVLPFRWEDFTPVGLVLVILGFYYCIHELPRWVLLSLVLWYLTFYFLLCGIPIQNPRIAFSLYQPLSIFAVLGILWCLRRWNAKRVMICVLVFTIVSAAFGVRYINKLSTAKNELREAAMKVAAATENSRIISTSLYAVYLAYPMKVEPMSIYTLSIAEAEAILADGKKTFLVIDDEKFIPQWSNYPAGKTYWWIRKHYPCIAIRRIGGFTVYEIKPEQNKCNVWPHLS